MIEKVRLEYFKRFKNQSFTLKDRIVLAGPNNSGKTTLLQALATWHFAFRKWQEKSLDSTRQRSIPLTRKEFLSVPVQRFNLLWTDTSTALKKDEGGGRGAASPRIMKITLEGNSNDGDFWQHTMEFRYSGSEQIYAKPSENTIPNESLNVVYVPSFSGIETEEPVHAPDYQEWLIGQGKPGDIIRNLLAETSKTPDWESLVSDIESIFGYRLLKPQYDRAFILCEYLPGIPKGSGYGGLSKLDIASAGSGFLQVLLLLSFFYARPSTIILIDEPDAHLHVNWQKQVYEHLSKVAESRGCQVVLATHSEVVINNTPPDRIVSFYGEPHTLSVKSEREQVAGALKHLSSMDILLSKRGRVLYGEDISDFNILRAWARILKHPLANWFDDPYYSPIKGNSPQTANSRFYALRAVNQQMLGVLLLDGDNKDIADHDISAKGLKIIRWKRYEIENYLLHPEVIKRFVEEKAGSLFASVAMKKMKNMLPPQLMTTPLNDDPYTIRTPASKEVLPKIITEAVIDIGKQEYYKIAEVMNPDEIHPEIKQKLDEITEHWDWKSTTSQ